MCGGHSDGGGSDGAVCVHTYAWRRVYVCIYIRVYAVLGKIYTTMKSVSATVLTNVVHSLEMIHRIGFIWVGILCTF